MPHAKEMAEYADSFIDNNEKHAVWQQATDWAQFGKNIAFNGELIHKNPEDVGIVSGTPEEEYFNKEKMYVSELINAFETSTAHYLNHQGVEKEDDWHMMYPAICRYNVTTEDTALGQGVVGPLAMAHHSDYELLKEEMPGDKFVVTCTVYLNDDYEGGGVEFLENGNAHLYKPKAGDVCVFPSGHPDYLSEKFRYFHGVEAVKSGKKFFVRIFWMKPYQGSEEWLANQEKYGEDVWAEMEKARIVAGMRKQDSAIIDLNVEKPLSFEDIGVDPEKECGLEQFRS